MGFNYNYKSALWVPENKIESTASAAEANRATWLDQAQPLDKHLGMRNNAINPLVDFIYDEIKSIYKNLRGEKNLRLTIQVILTNLFAAFMSDFPIKYSRNKNHYSMSKRYGRLFFKYDKVIPAINALTELGYIETVLGFYFGDNEDNRESRMWATKKLIRLFQEYKLSPTETIREPPEELIHLNKTITCGRKKFKEKLHYIDNFATRRMRNNLVEYNNYIKNQDIHVKVDGCVETKLFSLIKLYSDNVSGAIKPLHIDYTNNKYINTNRHKPNNINYTITNTIRDNFYDYKELYDFDYRSTAVIENTLNYQYNDDLARTILTNIHDDIFQMIKQAGGWKSALISGMLTHKAPLSDFGINLMVFAITYNYLHRVFNNGTFENGGRFAGARHISLDKTFRENIFMNGCPTVEPDYSSLHIRMLYHLEGIPYTADPYLAASENPVERKIYKNIMLVAINAKGDRGTIQAFLKKAAEEDSPYSSMTYAEVKRMLQRFKETHPRIAKYIGSRIGYRLMNLDSTIAEGVLMRMTRADIPCLPVHDSFIVPEQHGGILLQAMEEEYEKVMGFKPAIG